ncbi:transmembrane protein 192-like [Tubulanus polymorphus]|uniref:transmembrane protein 192-like n=1 Tax=Tubulanus polymorphus TaxID=672921 RepID=UPI003DA3BFB2
MVSLGPDNRRQGGQGGYFFDGDTSVNSSSEEAYSEHTLLSTEIEPNSRTINTVWAIVVQLLIVVIFEVLAFVIPTICPDVDAKKCCIHGYTLLIYLHACVWLLTFIIDRYLRYQHYFSRRNGYLEFYRRTRHIRRIPFFILSGGNALLTVVIIVLQEHENITSTKFNRNNYIQVIVSLETLATLPFLLVYLLRTVKFNQHNALPDACQDEMMTSFLISQAQSTEIGFKDENYLDEVLEKQADMIRYLRQHNADLGRKILELNAQLNIHR